MFSGPFAYLKHHLSVFVQVAFFDVQDAKNQSRYLRRLEDKRVLRAIRVLKTSLKRLCPSRLFRCPGCRKWVLMAFRHIETSLHRIHQSRFLRRREDNALRAIRLPKTPLMWPSMSLFSMDRTQKMRLHGVWLLETSLHRLYQSFFKTFWDQIISSKGQSPT
jgi:hypothetical protein